MTRSGSPGWSHGRVSGTLVGPVREEESRWIRWVRLPRGDAPPGTIVAQQPEAGLILPDKQPLVLTIAQGP